MNYKRTLVYLKSEMGSGNIRFRICSKPFLTFAILAVLVILLDILMNKINPPHILRVPITLNLAFAVIFSHYYSFVFIAQQEFNTKKYTMTRLQRRLIKIDLKASKWMSTTFVVSMTVIIAGAILIPAVVQIVRSIF